MLEGIEGKVYVQFEESIKLIRGQGGAYGWEIKVNGPRIDLWMVERLRKINKALSEAFAVNEDKYKDNEDTVSQEETNETIEETEENYRKEI